MHTYAKRIANMAGTAAVVKGLFGALQDPELISLGVGAPAKEALPVEILRELSWEVLGRDGRGIDAFQYGPTAGLLDLREVIAEHLLAPKGVKTTAEHILVTTGGMEAIALTCELFIEPGDVILVETPTFVQAVETFDMFEAKSIGVAMDDDGMILEDLEEKIKKYHPKMIYTIPTFQNPSGRTMSLERRKRMAEIVDEYNILVMEDDPYREIRYSGLDLPPIKAFDFSGNVIMVNSFSKMFSAGSRLGYIVANDSTMMEHILDVKSALNSQSSQLPQVLCAEFFKRGYYPDHHKAICDLYRKRRDAMVDSIHAFFPQGTTFAYPEGGLFTWAVLPEGLNTTELLPQAISRPDVKVAYVAGEKFFTDGDPVTNCMRLSFGAVPPEKIRAAVERLGKMFCDLI